MISAAYCRALSHHREWKKIESEITLAADEGRQGVEIYTSLEWKTYLEDLGFKVTPDPEYGLLLIEW